MPESLENTNGTRYIKIIVKNTENVFRTKLYLGM